MLEIKHFINGEFVGSASGKTFANINPATNQQIGFVHEAGKEEVSGGLYVIQILEELLQGSSFSF